MFFMLLFSLRLFYFVRHIVPESCDWDKQKKCCNLSFVVFWCANIQLFDIVTKHIAENLAKWTAPSRRLRCKVTE